jgi:asparagine synthase (glutamine-hydrolysing)
VSFCRSRFSFTPLELASGLVFGADHLAQPEEERVGNPIAALEAAILPALAGDGPCIVSFSGGRDSSAVLAVAAALARREGLPPPVPATNVFAGAGTADETRWQEEVVRHLGLVDWARLELEDELDAVGPVALEHLERHGLLWPFNAHFPAPLLRLARGGVLLTGIGGDELLGATEWARAAAVLSRAVRPAPRDALRVGLALAPGRVRAAVLRRRMRDLELEWLTDEANAALHGELASSLASEPLRWSERWVWWRRRRDTRVGRASLQLVADDCGARIEHPLTDRGFATAAARVAATRRIHDRTGVMAAIFGDVLPDSAIRRVSKATFDSVFFGEESRRFAVAAADEASSLDVVAPQALRAEWAKPTPDAHSLLLLQAIAVRRFDAAREPDRVVSCND